MNPKSKSQKKSRNVDKSPLLSEPIKPNEVAIEIPKSKSASPPKHFPSVNVVQNVNDTPSKSRWAGNHSILHNKWTAVTPKSTHLTGEITKQQKSARTDTKSFISCCIGNDKLWLIWDTLRYGICRCPQIGKMSYNPFVRISMKRSAVERDKQDDDNGNNDSDNDKAKGSKLLNVHNTLPIYGGGTDVTLRPCDHNKFEFHNVRAADWDSSWLRFEVWDDRVFSQRDIRIGVGSISIAELKDAAVGENKPYYTLIPLENKPVLKMIREAQRRLEREDNDHHDINTEEERVPLKAKGRTPSDEYLQLHDNDSQHRSKKKGSVSSEEMKSDLPAKEELDRDFHITGLLHVKATKNDMNSLTIEVIGITQMMALQVQSGWDRRRFYLGLLAFILYLLAYALIVFLAELDVPTGMNQYKESIWFALITVTTLGYGDITTTLAPCKILNAFFIFINMIIIASMINDFISAIVDAGENQLNDRMDQLKHEATENEMQSEQNKVRNWAFRRLSSSKRRINKKSKSVDMSSDHDFKSNGDGRLRRFSAPISSVKSSINALEEEKSNKLVDIAECKNMDQIQVQQEVVNEIEMESTNAQKMQLEELEIYDAESDDEFKKKIYINLVLFAIGLLFGFFCLGVAYLLDGPNYLTNLPYYNYDCDNEYVAKYCDSHRDVGTVIVDSLYYVIVSMSTVGYGDIYPDTGMMARLCGAIFILFGTVLLVRFIDITMQYFAWKHNMNKKKKILGKLLTSSTQLIQFDINQDGKISRYEFLRGMLLKLDLVEQDRIDEIMNIFEETDTSGDGRVDLKELRIKIKEDKMKLKWGKDAWKEIKSEWEKIDHEKVLLAEEWKLLTVERNRLATERKKLDAMNKARDIDLDASATS